MHHRRFDFKESPGIHPPTYRGDDLTAGRKRLQDFRVGEQINVPWLLVHGTEDDVVPIVDSRDILAKATNNPEFFEIAGADHVFSDDALSVMVGKVVEWVKAQAS